MNTASQPFHKVTTTSCCHTLSSHIDLQPLQRHLKQTHWLSLPFCPLRHKESISKWPCSCDQTTQIIRSVTLLALFKLHEMITWSGPNVSRPFLCMLHVHSNCCCGTKRIWFVRLSSPLCHQLMNYSTWVLPPVIGHIAENNLNWKLTVPDAANWIPVEIAIVNLLHVWTDVGLSYYGHWASTVEQVQFPAISNDKQCPQLAMVMIIRWIFGCLSAPHTSMTAFQDTCVCMSAYVCMAIYWKFDKYKGTHTFKIRTRVKALQNSCSVQVYTMDCSLPNSTPMEDLLKFRMQQRTPHCVTQHRWIYWVWERDCIWSTRKGLLVDCSIGTKESRSEGD